MKTGLQAQVLLGFGWRKSIQNQFILSQVGRCEATEDNFFNWRMFRQAFLDSPDGHLSSQFDRVPVYAGADAWESNRGNGLLLRQLYASAIAGGEQFCFSAFPSSPHRSDGVDDVVGR